MEATRRLGLGLARMTEPWRVLYLLVGVADVHMPGTPAAQTRARARQALAGRGHVPRVS